MESGGGVNVEVRATGLRGMREKKGLTQRELARNLGISQNYIPALESGARRPGPGPGASGPREAVAPGTHALSWESAGPRVG
jgi:hypothetical protein